MKEILQVKNVSIKYITGDFKSIGLKEYVVRRLKAIIPSKNFGQIEILPLT